MNSILKDQKVNWGGSKKETQIEEKPNKVISTKEHTKKIDTLIATTESLNEKCRELYEVKKSSEMYSVIVMNDVNIIELKKIKSKIQYETN
jgi:molybdopterin converting factor small subunit